ncbi:phage protein (partial) [Yersinia enterocolitica]|nr:phage protein (partial) [Yersinia mollaretii]CNK88480.1 phage protein (partial) [Yersinia enterocolitica]CQQ33533.1 phage protein (partial) [Yersinia mollaretii]
MGSIIKSEFNLKLVIFVSSVIIMISCYSLGSALYKSMFDITSHRSAGMIFISFYFLLIASPILFITLFIALRVSLALLFCGIGYLFFEWYSLHPLRVMLMGISMIMGYIFVLMAREKISSELINKVSAMK